MRAPKSIYNDMNRQKIMTSKMKVKQLALSETAEQRSLKVLYAFCVSFILLGIMVWTMQLAHSAESKHIQKVISPGGITAWLIEERSIPVISIKFAFSGGASQDEQNKSGTANLVSDMLLEGSGDLDSFAFEKELDKYAVKLSFSTGRDYFYGQLKTISTELNEAVRLAHMAISNPRFDEDALQRLKAAQIAGLKRAESDPNYIAKRLWSKTAFPDHPYGRPVAGTVESITHIKTDDLRHFYKNIFAREHLKVAVVGDIDAKTLAKILDRLFSDLPQKADLQDIPNVSIKQGGRVHESEDVPQTVINFGGPGLKRKDPDFITAYVVNHILGGGLFSSRLYNEVREKRGLAYGIDSYLIPYEHAAIFGGNTATRTDKAENTIEIIEQEIEKMATSGPTEEELEKAKAFLIGSYPLRFDSSGKIASQLLQIQLQNLGIDYIDKRNDLIRSVTIEDTHRVAKRLLDKDNLLIATVGQDVNQ